MERCEINCSCHLFEFRRIIYKHAITVLIRNDITRLPDKYTLRRWRRDVRRPHTRIVVNYDGLASTPGQLRYDEMSKAFSQVADLAADDEVRTRAVMDWIKFEVIELRPTKMCTGNSIISQHTLHLAAQCTDSQSTGSHSIRDPNLTKRKGAPRKLRRKSPLESTSKKAGATSMSCKGRRSRARQSNTQQALSDVVASEEQYADTFLIFRTLIGQCFGDAQSQVFAQDVSSSNLIPPLSMQVQFNAQGAAVILSSFLFLTSTLVLIL
ncbi:uncharacterized protein LOC111373622 [Olea europaea var. sylvestris]|uniref:uncharacterized protein LOC111373622 n=1 Tax=Olea europaea var. sylvestris TaxID=158386 RepID=UPI000C1D101D|nr:uncharacterized protein LOC111373622 [Olea europaea var. sylvestris]